MFQKFLIAFCLSVILTSPAYASACYSTAEAEAEQGIRIHSELMVIGLNCQHLYKSKGQNLYSAYRAFSNTNSSLFTSYENSLISYFSRTGSPNPEESLNQMRTKFANKIANDAARMRPDQFCKYYAGRIDKVSGMSQTTLKKWAGTFYPSHPTTQQICAKN